MQCVSTLNIKTLQESLALCAAGILSLVSKVLACNLQCSKHVQVQLEAEKSQSAKLDAEVRRLQSELIESASNNLKLKRSWLPVLHGIEAKLMQAAASAQDAAN